MELQEFLKFNHEYDEQYEMLKAYPLHVGYKKYFPKALANFAEKICEKQRENCVENYKYFETAERLGEAIFEINTKNILNAEQPKIEEL